MHHYLHTSLNLFKTCVNLFKGWRKPTKLLHHYIFSNKFKLFKTCNICYEKFVTHLLLYTVANVWRIFRNRRYKLNYWNSMSSIIDREQVSKMSNKFKLVKNNVKGRTRWSHTVKKLSCHTQSDMRWFKHLITIT